MPVCRRDDIDIFYETAGAGPPLVLIHPLPFDHNVWLYQQARFSDRFRVVAMDLRGWGRSSKPTEPFSLADMGADVLAVLAKEGATEDAVIMGCSVGSKIALMLACDHPEIFEAAILIGGNSGPQNQFDHRVAAYRANAKAGTLRDYHLGHLRFGVTARWADSAIGTYLLDGFAERGAGLNPDSIARVFEALTLSDITPKLPSFKTPTLIVNGEHDGALPGGTKTASLIAGCEHRILPGAGHCCFIEEPAAFDALAMDFLARNGLWPA